MPSGPAPDVRIGSTFWYPRGSGGAARPHLWFVLHVAEDGEFLAANATDAVHIKLESCCLKKAENRHPAIVKDSVMHFNMARRFTRKQFESAYRDGTLIMDAHASAETMQYLRKGFLESGHTTPAAKNFFLGKIPAGKR